MKKRLPQISSPNFLFHVLLLSRLRKSPPTGGWVCNSLSKDSRLTGLRISSRTTESRPGATCMGQPMLGCCISQGLFLPKRSQFSAEAVIILAPESYASPCLSDLLRLGGEGRKST